MQRIIFNKDVMGFIMFFESMTHSAVKDCIEGDNLIFVVDPGEMGKAIGRQGANVKRLEASLKKRIKIVEFNPNPAEFVKNLISPLQADVSEKDGQIIISSDDTRTKSLLIGRGSRNLENYKSIAGRYFDIKEMRIV